MQMRSNNHVGGGKKGRSLVFLVFSSSLGSEKAMTLQTKDEKSCIPRKYQRFVSSIGNIEKAMWVFNCFGSSTTGGYPTGHIEVIFVSIKYFCNYGGLFNFSWPKVKTNTKLGLLHIAAFALERWLTPF